MSAFRFIDSLVSADSRMPIPRAGRRKSGKSMSAARVNGQESTVIVPTIATRVTVLLTTADKVDVKACCAPITSVLSLEASAPVRVRVKKANG